MPARALPTCVLPLILLGPSIAGAERFEPESFFPKETFFYASIDASKVREGLQQSLVGTWLSHPGVRRALGRLPDLVLERLRQGTREFTQAVGVDPIQLLELLEGEIALTIPRVDIRQGPTVLLSIQTGRKRSEIEKVVENLGQVVSSESGVAATTSQVKGHTVTTWPMRYGPSVQHVILGSAIVFSVGEGLESVIERFVGGGESDDALKFNVAYARGKVQVTGVPAMATVFWNWELTRDTILGAAGNFPDGEELRRIFGALGLDKLSSATFRMGFRDGGLESKLALDFPGGPGGLLGLSECIGGPAEDAAQTAMSKVPAQALEIASFSIAKGKLIQLLLEKLDEGFPALKPTLDSLKAEFERRTGLSLAREVYLLPRLSLTAFSVLPPAGGIVPDALALARASELEPYLRALDKAARAIGADVTQIDVGDHPVAYIRADGLLSKLGLFPPPATARGHGPEVVFDLDLSLAFTPLDEGGEWILIATTPQAISRYLSHYSKLPTTADDAKTMALCKAQAGKDGAYALLRGGRGLGAVYDTAVSLATLVAPSLRSQLAPLGLDPVYLPGGEALVEALQGGFVIVHSGKASLVIHGHRVPLNVLGSPTFLSSLLAVAAKAAIAARLPVEPAGASMAAAATPADRLKALGEVLTRFAENSGTGAFPYDPAGSLASFQKLVDSGLLEDVGLLVHPLGAESPAKPGGGGKIVLGESNLSYELAGWKQGPRDHPRRILAYERKAYEKGGRHVLFVDMSVAFLPEEAFLQLLGEQTKKYRK